MEEAGGATTGVSGAGMRTRATQAVARLQKRERGKRAEARGRGGVAGRGWFSHLKIRAKTSVFICTIFHTKMTLHGTFVSIAYLTVFIQNALVRIKLSAFILLVDFARGRYEKRKCYLDERCMNNRIDSRFLSMSVTCIAWGLPATCSQLCNFDCRPDAAPKTSKSACLFAKIR